MPCGDCRTAHTGSSGYGGPTRIGGGYRRSADGARRPTAIRKESFLSLPLFLIPARRDSETYRATIGRPAEAGFGCASNELLEL